MTIYPAIDLRGGHCVRLTEGDFSRETVYGDDPVAMARRWRDDGARWLHVVDLDGARAGAPVQADVVARICRAVDVPVQVGGGLRDEAAVRTVLDAGAARAIVGTVAVRDPDLCERLCTTFPGRIVVGIDARDGIARVSGWEEGSTLAATDLAATMAKRGATAIVYTDIARDGMRGGPNLDATGRLARKLLPCPVIASGGVSRLEDLDALAPTGAAAVVVGKALYEKVFTIEQAVARLRAQSA